MMIPKSWLACGALPLALACNRAGNAQPMEAVPSAAATGAAPAPVASAVGPSLLAVGAEVPDVAAPAQDGKLVKLRELKGKPIVVYFYPKDDTPGCTVEAKGIRDHYAELNRLAHVLGVSSDSLESHKEFASKYDLPFQLLEDTSHAIATAFGVPLSGGYARRVTFVIDAAGRVRKVFPNVDPSGHADELIETLKSLG